VSCDDDEVVRHRLAVRSAFRHSNGSDERKRSLQPAYDARARPTELRTLSRAGAVARFALRRRVSPPPGEPRRSTPPSGTCLATRRLPLRVMRVSGARRLSRSLRARPAPAWGAERRGPAPKRYVRRRSPPLLHDAPSCDDPSRHHGERRGPRPARSCQVAARRSYVPALVREWYTTGSPPRERPRTPFVIGPGACMAGVAGARLGFLPPGRPRSSFTPPPAKEEAFAKTRVLGSAS